VTAAAAPGDAEHVAALSVVDAVAEDVTLRPFRSPRETAAGYRDA
jgi:hypothetical protein